MGPLPNSQVNLALDLGNSTAKAALFRGGTLTGEVLRFGYDQWSAADDWVTNHGVENIVYSSVANVPPPTLMDKWKNAGRVVYAVRYNGTLPFPSGYTTPETLGQDRVAAIMGVLDAPANPRFMAPAASQYSDTRAPVTTSKLIVDAGSCITADVVDSTGRHLGGNISPGIRMRLRAMHEFTARLPLAEGDCSDGELGLTTESALLHGAHRGALYELEGLYGRLLATHPRLDVIFTGGDGASLSAHFSTPSVFRPHLVLRGLIKLLSNYASNES